MKKLTPRALAWPVGVLVAAGVGFLAGRFTYGPTDEGRRVYARFNGQAIRGADVMEQIRGDLEQLERTGYAIRRQAVEKWVQAKLREDAKTSTPAPGVEVSDAEIDQYLKARNLTRGKLSAAQLHDLAGNLKIQKQAIQQKEADALRLAQVDLQWKLPLPGDRRISLASGWSPRLGAWTGNVDLIFVGNFHCPTCRTIDQRARQFHEKYPDRTRLHFRFAMDEPMDSIVRITAEAAMCAKDQQQFWPFHDRLMAAPPAQKVDELVAHATALKLDAGAFRKCVDERTHQGDVQSDATETRAAGVTDIPSLVINRHLVAGPASLVDTELVLTSEF